MEQRVSQSFFTQYVSVILIVLTILLSTLSQPRTAEPLEVTNRGIAFTPLPEVSEWLPVENLSGDSVGNYYLLPREALLNAHDLILEVEVRAPTYVEALQRAGQVTSLWQSRPVQDDAVRVSLMVDPSENGSSLRERWLRSIRGTSPLLLTREAGL